MIICSRSPEYRPCNGAVARDCWGSSRAPGLRSVAWAGLASRWVIGKNRVAPGKAVGREAVLNSGVGGRGTGGGPTCGACTRPAGKLPQDRGRAPAAGGGTSCRRSSRGTEAARTSGRMPCSQRQIVLAGTTTRLRGPGWRWWVARLRRGPRRRGGGGWVGHPAAGVRFRPCLACRSARVADLHAWGTSGSGC
jgi:hypothetical protein